MRGYQYDFSLGAPSVHDHAGRRRKARTMIAVLEQLGGVHLAAATVLDVGASTGAIDSELAGVSGRVMGIDIDSHAIAFAHAQWRADNLAFVLGDALALPCAADSVDVVVCAHVYEHVADAARLMREIGRVLRPGGVCYFGAGNRYAWREPHYGLPLLGALPKPMAHRYLRLLGRGTHYYETHLGHAGLRRLCADFERLDCTRHLLAEPERFGTAYMVPQGSLKQRLALAVYDCAPWLCPSYVWLLRKPAKQALHT